MLFFVVIRTYTDFFCTYAVEKSKRPQLTRIYNINEENKRNKQTSVSEYR